MWLDDMVVQLKQFTEKFVLKAGSIFLFVRFLSLSFGFLGIFLLLFIIFLTSLKLSFYSFFGIMLCYTVMCMTILHSLVGIILVVEDYVFDVPCQRFFVQVLFVILLKLLLLVFFIL